MSDENPAPQSEQAAQPDDGAGDDDGEQVVLTRAQLDSLFKSAKNSAAAEMRRSGEFKRQKHQQQPAEDPRVKRGLELLAIYEQAEATEAKQRATLDAVSLTGSKRGAPQQQAQTPAAQQQSSRLEQMFEMFLTTQLADKMPRAPITYASQIDQVHGELNEQIAAIDKNDPQRNLKIQQVVGERLRTVKLAGSAPRVAVNPNKK